LGSKFVKKVIKTVFKLSWIRYELKV